MKTVIVIAILLLLSEPAIAEGVATSFTVESVRADNSGEGFVVFTQSLGGTPPSCVDTTFPSQKFAQSLAFDANTPGGKIAYSTALTAQVTGKKITARGTGACGIYGVMEDWVWGKIHD